MPTRLPVVLENLRIATPCSADWDDMSGNQRVRFCGQCEKNVYNLSAMTRLEAESLVSEKEGRLCVRLYQRQDGTVITADCPVGVRRQRLRQRVWASLTGAAARVALVLGLLTGRARGDLTLRDGKKAAPPMAHIAMGGDVAIVQPPPKVEVAPPKPKKKPLAPPKPQPQPMKMGEPMMGDISAER